LCFFKWNESWVGAVRNFRKQPTPPRNDVWGTSVDFPYWWHVITRIWAVLLIGRTAREICFSQSKHYPELGDTNGISRGNHCGVAKFSAVTRASLSSPVTSSQAPQQLLLLSPVCLQRFPQRSNSRMLVSSSLHPVFTASVSSPSIREPAYNNAFLCIETKNGREG